MARISPARAHVMRTLAAAAPAEEVTPAHANQYELMLAQLTEHKRRLKQVKSIERKIELKRQLLPDYAPWVEGVLTGGKGQQDDVLMTIMVWHIDVGEVAMALPIAEYALKHGLTLPDQYKRDLACLLAEEVAELSIKQHAAGELVDIGSLLQIEELTRAKDMPDEVRAKLHKAAGYGLCATDKPAALEHFKRALQLYDKVGVKKDIEKLERELKNTAFAGTGEGQKSAPSA